MDRKTRIWAWLGTCTVIAALTLMALIVHMPAQAWVTLVIGVVATGGVLLSWQQKSNADRRAEWWRRATWAVDHTLSDNVAARHIGLDVLAKLQESALITATEANVFAEYGRELLAPGASSTNQIEGSTEGGTRRAAARMVIAADKAAGRPEDPEVFAVAAGKFEVYEDANGRYRFRLKTASGEVVASGQSYSSRKGALSGIEAVKRAVTAGKFEVYEDANGRYRFRLKTASGEVVASGQSYSSREGVLASIDAIKRAVGAD